MGGSALHLAPDFAERQTGMPAPLRGWRSVGQTFLSAMQPPIWYRRIGEHEPCPVILSAAKDPNGLATPRRFGGSFAALRTTVVEEGAEDENTRRVRLAMTNADREYAT